MNEMFENLSNGDGQRLLDRLVDGEITHDEQRQLILSLEAQPDGWRQCALAFLEAQTWSREFGDLLGARAKSATTIAAASVPATHRVGRWLKPLTIAAGLVLTFTLGMAVRGAAPLGEKELAAEVTNQQGELTASKSPDESNVPATVDLQTTKYETVKVSVPSGDGDSEQTLELPLIEADQKSLASILSEQKPVLSDLELKTLESTGHQVEQRRAYYPVQLQDGRRAVLPMDLVEVKYTGGWQ
jgi:hypothetical protein